MYTESFFTTAFRLTARGGRRVERRVIKPPADLKRFKRLLRTSSFALEDCNIGANNWKKFFGGLVINNILMIAVYCDNKIIINKLADRPFTDVRP
jgi:hypothetical protein